jgi:hypothetical protein
LNFLEPLAENLHLPSSRRLTSSGIPNWLRGDSDLRLQKDEQFLDEVAFVLYMFQQEKTECPVPSKPFRLAPSAWRRLRPVQARGHGRDNNVSPGGSR